MTAESSVPNPLHRALFTQLGKAAQAVCAPFWWSITKGDQPATILNNGTICYINTGSREIAVTANHVFEKYLEHLRDHGPDAIECQFRGSTVAPEKRVISQSRRWDLATFDIPAVFVAAALRSKRSQHHAEKWPPDRVAKGDVVLYGGFPGSLRVERGPVADLPFQWLMGLVSDVGSLNIVLEPNFETGTWLGAERNDDPGGMSGGPVFRVREDLIVRLQLVGFIDEFSCGQAILARHAGGILADGTIDG